MSIFGNQDPQTEQLDQLKKLATEQTLKRLQQSIDNLNRSLGRSTGGGGSSTDPTAAIRAAASSLDTLTRASDAGRAALDQHARLASQVGADAINAAATQRGILSRAAGQISSSSGFMAKSYLEMSTRGGVAASSMELMGKGMWQLAGKFPVFGALIVGTIEIIKMYSSAMNEGLAVYRQLSQHGITLGSNLLETSVMAANANMDLKDFVGIIGNASETIAGAFGNAVTGAKQMADVGVAFNSTSRQLGKELRTLGFTNEQILEGATLFYEMNKNNASLATMSADDQAQATTNLLKEIDGLSMATGKERKGIEDRLKDMAKQASTQATAMMLPENVRAGVIKSMGLINETLGTAGKDLYQNVIDGRGYTEAAKGAMSAIPGLFEMFNEDAKRVKAGQQSQIDNQVLAEKFQSLTEDQMTNLARRAQSDAARGNTAMMDIYQKALELRRQKSLTPEEKQAYEDAKRNAKYWAEITNGVESIWRKIKNFSTLVFSKINEMFGGNLIEQAVDIVDKWLSPDKVDAFATAIVGFFRGVVDWFKGIDIEATKKTVLDFWNGVVGFFTTASANIGLVWSVFTLPFTLAKALGTAIGETIGAILGVFIDVGVAIYKGGKWLYEHAGDAFTGIGKAIDWVKDKWNAVSDLMQPLGDALKNFGTTISNMIAKVQSWLPSWAGGSSAPTAPSGGGSAIDSQLDQAIRSGSVPSLASGGIVSGPTSGYISLMHGTEAVVPLPQGANMAGQAAPQASAANDLVNALSDQNSSLEDVKRLLEQMLASFSRVANDMTDLVSETREVSNNTRSASIALR